MPVVVHISNNVIAESSRRHSPGRPLQAENTMRAMVNLSRVAGGIACLIVLMANAVSYTHLDVYKRQVLHT